MTPPQTLVVRSPVRCVDGLRVAISVQGEGDPLLLINGMTRPLQSWDQFTQNLSGRTIISYDAPGVGASPTPLLPLSIGALAALAVAVLAAAGRPDTELVDVLGFSHGGAVAQQLAKDSPLRLRRLVLAATSCGVGATTGGRPPALRSIAPQRADRWQRPDPIGVLWQSLAFSSWSSIPFLGAIATPTLVVCGSRDRVVPPDNSRVLAARIPGARLALLHAGHDLQRAEPAGLMASLVEDFASTSRQLLREPAGG